MLQYKLLFLLRNEIRSKRTEKSAALCAGGKAALSRPCGAPSPAGRGRGTLPNLSWLGLRDAAIPAAVPLSEAPWQLARPTKLPLPLAPRRGERVAEGRERGESSLRREAPRFLSRWRVDRRPISSSPFWVGGTLAPEGTTPSPTQRGRGTHRKTRLAPS
jgi:hypothetical protein